MFLDLELDRPRPRPPLGAWRRVHVVQEAALTRSRRGVAWGPFLLAAFEVQLQVVILVGARAAQLPEAFARNTNRGGAIDVRHDRKDSERVPARPNGLHVF